MTTRELHPDMDPGDMIDVLRDGRTRYDVMGVTGIDQVQTVQACCDALYLDVRWRVHRVYRTWVLEVGR